MASCLGSRAARPRLTALVTPGVAAGADLGALDVTAVRFSCQDAVLSRLIPRSSMTARRLRPYDRGWNLVRPKHKGNRVCQQAPLA